MLWNSPKPAAKTAHCCSKSKLTQILTASQGYMKLMKKNFSEIFLLFYYNVGLKLHLVFVSNN